MINRYFYKSTINNFVQDSLETIFGKLSLHDEGDTASTQKYAWAEEIPAEFGLQNYTFTVVATAVEQPEPPVDPEQPGTSEEPEEPGTSEEPEEPGSSEEPEEPGTSEEPSDSEKPSILDQVKGMIPGCSGVVGGIAGGVAALGIAAVALLKKKEDNE